jgi:hypothetical protein
MITMTTNNGSYLFMSVGGFVPSVPLTATTRVRAVSLPSDEWSPKMVRIGK